MSAPFDMCMYQVSFFLSKICILPFFHAFGGNFGVVSRILILVSHISYHVLSHALPSFLLTLLLPFLLSFRAKFLTSVFIPLPFSLPSSVPSCNFHAFCICSLLPTFFLSFYSLLFPSLIPFLPLLISPLLHSFPTESPCFRSYLLSSLIVSSFCLPSLLSAILPFLLLSILSSSSLHSFPLPFLTSILQSSRSFFLY